MKKRTIFLALALGSTWNLAISSPYSFDSNNQGWQQARIGKYGSITYETLSANAPADWTGGFGVGSPDGSIFQSSNGSNGQDRPYWMGTIGITAGSTLGNLTGKTLQAYIRSTANWAGLVSADKVYLRWMIADSSAGVNNPSNMWVSKAIYSIDLNDPVFGSGSDSDWQLFSIQMTQDRFFQWPNNSNGGTFASVLTNYTSFGFAILPTAAGSDALNNFNGQSGTWGTGSTLLHYGATSSNGQTATWGVDYMGVAVPGPAAALPFLGGLLMALKRRRK